jgi:signal transduction histidine kinase/DNA-binding response OmpR family regulator
LSEATLNGTAFACCNGEVSILPGMLTRQPSMLKVPAKFGRIGFRAHDQASRVAAPVLHLPAELPGAAVLTSNPPDASQSSPTSDLVVWPAKLIQASALVIVLFELASVLGEIATHSASTSHQFFRAVCLLLGTLLFSVSLQPCLGRLWQPLAFVITSGVVVLTTIVGIDCETADQFFVNLLVLSLGASSLLPWSFGWQAAANAEMLISLAAFAHLSPAHDPLLYTHWVGLVAGAAIRQLCANYGGRYRQEIARDIVELKRSETELIAAREAALAALRAKSEFLSSMSHEIRTPMNAVLGMADVLVETDLNHEQRRYLNTIINNGTALLELINSILDLAKVESGRVSLESVAFSPREVVERVLETLAIRAHEKGLELVGQIDLGVPELVLGDPFRVRQILINLIGNAVKFTERGHVLVVLQTDPTAAGLLQFEVRDTGIGIPAEKLDSLFQAFNQVDSSTSRRYGGSGLGLAIVARLVALMGGVTTVESRPGKGSVFRFSTRFALPANQVPHERELPDLSNRRILVADDNDVNREAVQLLLSERGAAVVVATSGAAAPELIRRAEQSAPFDAIVIDSSVSDLDGYQMMQLANHAQARFIMMLPSGNLKSERLRLQPLGIENYVMKPVKRGELLAAVVAAMGQRPALASTPARTEDSEHMSAVLREPCLRILFADDSPDNRALIKAYMKNTPHLIEFAEDGKEAVTKFEAGRYDMVFMDIQMPIVDGYTAVEEIRRWENYMRHWPTPIVALTASADSEAVRRTKEAGCNLHVSKPLKKATLLETIKRCAPPTEAAVVAGPLSQEIAETGRA